MRVQKKPQEGGNICVVVWRLTQRDESSPFGVSASPVIRDSFNCQITNRIRVWCDVVGEGSRGKRGRGMEGTSGGKVGNERGIWTGSGKSTWVPGSTTKRVMSELVGTRIRCGDRACSSSCQVSSLGGAALGVRPDAFSSSRGFRKPVLRQGEGGHVGFRRFFPVHWRPCPVYASTPKAALNE